MDRRKLYEKLFPLILLPFVTLTLYSCKNDEEQQVQIKKQQTNIDAYDAFLVSVDSLNQLYPENNTRGSFWSGFGVATADYIGYACGGNIGSWVGGAVCSLSGNPLGTITGTVIGKAYGPAQFGAIASGLANMVC